VLGREFGDSLRAAIARTGLLESELARRLGWEHAKLSDLVNGKGGVNLEEFTYLLGVCQTKPDELRYLRGLYLESREKGWLQLYESPVPVQLRTLINHQKLAKKIVIWSALFVPGLTQIEPYARAVVKASPAVKANEVEGLVAARMARREIVENNRKFVFYVYEPVLTSPVGGSDVLREQLFELMRLLVRPYISLRIVPAGLAVCGDFSMLTFDKYEPVVYVESLNSALFLDDKASISLHQKVLDALDRVALSEEESRELIDSIVS